MAAVRDNSWPEGDALLAALSPAMVALMDELPGMSFGHAGTVVEKKLDSPADKIRRMRAAGIEVADEIGDIPRIVRERIAARKAGAAAGKES